MGRTLVFCHLGFRFRIGDPLDEFLERHRMKALFIHSLPFDPTWQHPNRSNEVALAVLYDLVRPRWRSKFVCLAR